MKSAKDVLTCLRSLAEQDRSWILAQLPADAKARLLGEQRARSRAVSAPLAEADAAHACNTLRSEPAWLLAAILRVQPESWQSKFLAGLPEWTRLQVQRLASTTYTTPMLDSILQLAEEKVAECAPASRDSRFAGLVARMSAARARKRWSL